MGLFRSAKPSTNTSGMAFEAMSCLPLAPNIGEEHALCAQETSTWPPLILRECGGCGAELPCAGRCGGEPANAAVVVLLSGIAARGAHVCTCTATCPTCPGASVGPGRASAFVALRSPKHGLSLWSHSIFSDDYCGAPLAQVSARVRARQLQASFHTLGTPAQHSTCASCALLL